LYSYNIHSFDHEIENLHFHSQDVHVLYAFGL